MTKLERLLSYEEKVGEDAGYFAAHEKLECLPMRPIALLLDNHDFTAFVAQNTGYCKKENFQQHSSCLLASSCSLRGRHLLVYCLIAFFGRTGKHAIGRTKSKAR